MKKRYLFRMGFGVERYMFVDNDAEAMDEAEQELIDLHTLYPNDVPSYDDDIDGFIDYLTSYCEIDEAPFTYHDYCDLYRNMEAHDMEQIFSQLGRINDEMRQFAQTMFSDKEIDEAIEAFDKAQYLYGKLREAAEEGMDDYE